MSEVKQALPQFLSTKPERQAVRTRADGRDFGEALARTSKRNAPAAHDAGPRWPRLSMKLDAAIDRASGLGSTLALNTAISGASEDQNGSDEGDAVPEGEDKAAGTEDAGVRLLSGLHLPQFHVRRLSGKDAEPASRDTPAEDRDGDAIAGIPVDSGPGKTGSRMASAARTASDALVAPTVDAGIVAEQAATPVLVDAAVGHLAGTTTENRTQSPNRGPADASRTARATVLSEQSFPAPMPSTALALADSIASSGALASPAKPQATDTIQGPPGPAPAHSLKIQLHPAELGVVTATMRFAGEQLSIELRVENSDAYRRLSADTETIVKSLRGLGYEIDKVTVLQPVIALVASTRPDGGSPFSAQAGRGGEQSGTGATGGGNTGTGGQKPGGDSNNARRDGQPKSLVNMARAGGGVYI